MRSHLQFTLRGLMWATFWAAASAAAGRLAWTSPHPAVQFAAGVVVLAGPCTAIGALWGRTTIGLIVGIVVACLGLIALATMIYVDY